MNTELKAIAIAFVIACAASMASANMPRNIFAPDPVFSMSNMIFADTLALNESKTISVRANEPWNYTGIKAIEGQKYRFTVGSPEWNNGFKETDASGYDDTGPYANLRRHLEYKTMALVVEFHSQDRNPVSYMGRRMFIGKGPREWKASVTGYMVALANDAMTSYADNSRVVTLTIKRIPAS